MQCQSCVKRVFISSIFQLGFGGVCEGSRTFFVFNVVICFYWAHRLWLYVYIYFCILCLFSVASTVFFLCVCVSCLLFEKKIRFFCLFGRFFRIFTLCLSFHFKFHSQHITNFRFVEFFFSFLLFIEDLCGYGYGYGGCGH
eukprot:c27958_g1_i1.p1 GENE.c27958_g1_i1~~c27958_g1_i1.p1  ORF type:complete len:141 (+),score=10.78 c27958_g1_i1:227-649(+)